MREEPPPGTRSRAGQRLELVRIRPSRGGDTRACQCEGQPCSEQSLSDPTDTKFKESKHYFI